MLNPRDLERRKPANLNRIRRLVERKALAAAWCGGQTKPILVGEPLWELQAPVQIEARTVWESRLRLANKRVVENRAAKGEHLTAH